MLFSTGSKRLREGLTSHRTLHLLHRVLESFVAPGYSRPTAASRLEMAQQGLCGDDLGRRRQTPGPFGDLLQDLLRKCHRVHENEVRVMQVHLLEAVENEARWPLRPLFGI